MLTMFEGVIPVVKHWDTCLDTFRPRAKNSRGFDGNHKKVHFIEEVEVFEYYIEEE